MSYLLCFLLISFTTSAWAEDQYLSGEKVLYEEPQEQDVLIVRTALGFCTVLEFPEKPTMVSVGDNSIVQIEVPQNSKSIVLKPLAESGETNLFVFTATQRFNYKVMILDQPQVDYVVKSQQSPAVNVKTTKVITIGELLKMAKSYPVLQALGNINKREFTRKDLMYLCSNPKFEVSAIEAFSYRSPRHLIFHLKVRNLTDQTHDLNEQHTNVYVGNEKFQPQYVAFDETKIDPKSSVEGWLILAGTNISLDNKFTFGIGVGDAEGICY